MFSITFCGIFLFPRCIFISLFDGFGKMKGPNKLDPTWVDQCIAKQALRVLPVRGRTREKPHPLKLSVAATDPVTSRSSGGFPTPYTKQAR